MPADRELGRLAALLPPHELIFDVALPLMRIAGERWHEQRMRIAQEHVMSQLLSNLLGSIMRTYAPLDPPAVVMTAQHSATIFMSSLSWLPRFSSRVQDWALSTSGLICRRRRSFTPLTGQTRVVSLSLTNPQDRMLREEQLRSIRAGFPKHTAVWVGVNPGDTVLNVNGIRVLRDFSDLERELAK